MRSTGEIVVVRVGHRPGRDDRMTTHVGLTARALGADRFVLAAEDSGPIRRINDVTERFGGPFETELIDSAKRYLSQWQGRIVHLTMYGIPLQERIESIRTDDRVASDGIAIVVGAEKVSFDLYERADWNVAVTNQPHSEVASLAVFLDRIFADDSLETTMVGGTHRIIPCEVGKRVEAIKHDE